jgi:glycosyltransferase involved in cell wall biosynthesis
MASQAPKVSVIMPVLNEEGHLADAVNSVLAQDFQGELLIALGPSTDGTNAVAKKLANSDERIRLIENPRGLTTVAMNTCIAVAKHAFVSMRTVNRRPATFVEVLKSFRKLELIWLAE